MKTSARNQCKGTIETIKAGQVNSEIVLNVSGNTIKAIITNDAVSDMELAAGQEVYAIIKASFVMVAKEKPGKISTRNILETTVSDIINGMVNCELKLSMGETTLTAIITEEAAKDLEIAKGDTVYALIKASSIILAQ
ncbi:MAG: TOBE domain-containing protein [Campylobacterales bacterium]|jgi:molybdate transport system regulatory protein